jgi:hypothetical protein
MKAYLITTGILFGLLAVMHLVQAIDEAHFLLSTDPKNFLGMAGLGVVAACFSGWAFRLLRKQARS